MSQFKEILVPHGIGPSELQISFWWFSFARAWQDAKAGNFEELRAGVRWNARMQRPFPQLTAQCPWPSSLWSIRGSHRMTPYGLIQHTLQTGCLSHTWAGDVTSYVLVSCCLHPILICSALTVTNDCTCGGGFAWINTLNCGFRRSKK
jgi:hypothetical protein